MDKGFYKDYFVLEREHWFFKARRNILVYFIKKYSKLGSVVFDFGCGSGYLVGNLQKAGYDSHGMDFEKEAIDYGLNSGIKNLVVGTGERIDQPDGRFDLVMSFDVLEHIEDEKPAILELIRILRPGGKMVVTVPAYMWLWGVQDEVSHHFRRYSSKSLAEVFKQFSDLRIIQKTYYNTFLFPVIAVVRLFSKMFNIKGRESDFEINNPVLNSIFYNIFNLESYLLRLINFPFGVSIMFVLEKNAKRN